MLLKVSGNAEVQNQTDCTLTHQPGTQLLPAKQNIWRPRRLIYGHTEEVTDMGGLQPCLFPTGISLTSPYLCRLRTGSALERNACRITGSQMGLSGSGLVEWKAMC